VFLLIGFSAMLMDCSARIRRYWQRRRIGKLLGGSQLSENAAD